MSANKLPAAKANSNLKSIEFSSKRDFIFLFMKFSFKSKKIKKKKYFTESFFIYVTANE